MLQESGTIVLGRNIKFFPSVSMVIPSNRKTKNKKQKINFRLDGITIDTLGKNLIFRPKTIVPLSCNINLLLARRPNLSQCFSVIFVEEPPFDVLDICEDKWFHKLGASINLQTMILPATK